jgi:rhomboid protease GluP
VENSHQPDKPNQPQEETQPEIIIPAEEQLQPQPQVRIKLPDSKPFVTYTIIGITVVVFLLQNVTQTFLGFDLPVEVGIKYNPLIDAGQYWRLIAPVLLHGDILHIGFNMYAVFILGRELERFYGHGRFLMLYLATGFAGGTASYLMTAAPSLGASTATFGLLAAYGVLGYRNRKIFGQQSQRIVRNVIQIAVINFLLGLSPGIDNWGHFGGAVGGIALSWFGGPRLQFNGAPPELELKDKTTRSEFLSVFLAVVGIIAIAAIMLDGAG